MSHSYICKRLKNKLLTATIAIAFTVTPSVVRAENKSSHPSHPAESAPESSITASNMTETSARRLEQTASRLIDARRMPEARRICQIVCQSNYATAESYSLLANSYLNGMGDESKTQLAKSYLDKALTLNAKSALAHSVMANMANEEGRFEDAVKSADQAITCPNPPIVAYLSKASALTNLNRNAEALVAVEKAEALDVKHKNPSILWVKASILENLKRFSAAANCYEKSLALFKSDWIYFRLIHCLEMQNKLADAIGVSTQVLVSNPKDGEAYRTRAVLKVKSNDLAGALKDYNTCIDLEPTAKTFRDRAQVHLKLGHKDQYQKDLSEAQKIDSRPIF